MSTGAMNALWIPAGLEISPTVGFGFAYGKSGKPGSISEVRTG